MIVPLSDVRSAMSLTPTRIGVYTREAQQGMSMYQVNILVIQNGNILWMRASFHMRQPLFLYWRMIRGLCHISISLAGGIASMNDAFFSLALITLWCCYWRGIHYCSFHCYSFWNQELTLNVRIWASTAYVGTTSAALRYAPHTFYWLELYNNTTLWTKITLLFASCW